MGAFDQAARFAADADPEAAVRRALKDSGLDVPFRDWFDTRSVPMPGGADRTADRVAALAGEPPTLVVFEFQARHDPGKLAVTLEEVAALRSRLGEPEHVVLAALVYLVGVCPSPVLAMTTPTGFGTLHRPLVWNVEQDDAAMTLGRVERGEAPWGMLFWVPLMAGADDAAVVERWKDVVTTRVSDPQMRSNLIGIALVFAELAGRGRMWQEKSESWETESQVVNGWIRKGIERTKMEDARHFLTRTLTRRFGSPVPPEVQRVIDEQPSLAMLQGWFDEALTVASLDDFVAVLRR